MNKVFQLPLNWAVLQPYLAKADDDGNINYTEFLTRYQINVDEYVTCDNFFAVDLISNHYFLSGKSSRAGESRSFQTFALKSCPNSAA